MTSAFFSLLRFHLGAGARLAARVSVPVLVATAAAAMFLGPDFLASAARLLFGADAGIASGAVVLLAFVGIARVAVQRICRELSGWVRHLPAGPAMHRRAALFAITLVEVPVLLGFAVLAVGASGARGGNALRELALALPLRALAAAVFALPVTRWRLTRTLALGAGLLAGGRSPGLLTLAAALLLAADLAGGGLRPVGDLPRRRRSADRLIEARIAWRALGWRTAGAYACALLPLAMGWAFVAHNELPPLHQARGALLAGSLALALLFAALGDSLAVLRPAWPWARSLPWSAARRVRGDALLLGAHALPLVLATAVLAPWTRETAAAVLAVLALVPPLAVRTAGAVRRAPERRSGASGEILLEAGLAALLAALLPWTAALALLATPWLFRVAARRERRQKVSRWLELHSLAVGDPQSWSAG
ncbi:MAG TPA: hypothetical protein VHQ90_14195 [Thermoanaerobaculia bacterium]|nr:hypothetical protein [Thermoanaerobaculia bacterium]